MKEFVSVGYVDKFNYLNLSDDRWVVIVGGLVILIVVFKVLDIEGLIYLFVVLREGVLY